MNDNAASPTLRWRFAAGAAIGLLVGALFSVPLAGQIYRVAGVDRDLETDELYFETWMGLEPPSILLLIYACCFILMPMIGILIQRRPMFPRLATMPVFAAGAVLAGIACWWSVIAFFAQQGDYFWALHD